MDDYERYATGLMIVFGALIIGGLMAANLYHGDKPGFLLRLARRLSAGFQLSPFCSTSRASMA